MKLRILLLAFALWSPAAWAVNDGSLNQETIPPTGFTCTVALAVNYGRGIIEVQNRSTDAVRFILDDGAGGHATIMSLGAALAGGQDGGAWSDPFFMGRLQVCVPTANAATDTVAARED
jgi:hypothetical protein